MRSALLCVLMLPAALGVAGPQGKPDQSAFKTLPRDRPSGELELVATFSGPMPTGVTVASAPPVTITLARPRRIHSAASPMACAPLEHALVVQ